MLFHHLHHRLHKAVLPRFYMLIGFVCWLIMQTAYAQTIKIYPNTVISYPRTYNNVTLDMSEGSFIIKENATLTITNCVVNGTLAKTNPILFNIDNGHLAMKNNQVNIKTFQLPEHPTTQSLEYVIQTGQGDANLQDNNFVIDKPFTAGLLITTSTIPTANFTVLRNKFDGFHGVLYLISSNYSYIADNIFNKDTYGHIVIMGNHSQIIHNTIMFAGNDKLGNSIDVINSSDVQIKRNLLFTPTCHGIYILNSRDMTLDGNYIQGGITYAMTILTYPEVTKEDKYLLGLVQNVALKPQQSSNITITNNYMAQNRYGIAASDISNLTIKNNYFVQRFEDNASRKFWTNNNVILQNITGLTWTDNLYKEAFTQAMEGDNTNSKAFVPFPQSGGVVFAEK